MNGGATRAGRRVLLAAVVISGAIVALLARPTAIDVFFHRIETPPLSLSDTSRSVAPDAIFAIRVDPETNATSHRPQAYIWLGMGERAKASPHVLQQNYKHGIQRIPLALQETEIPVIAAVNGPAIGAGFDLANMCDIRIGSTNAQFGETFVNLGIIAGDGGAWFLQRLVGYQRAAELTFSGRIVKAEEAKQLGILLEVTEPAALLPRARELAAKIAAKPPLAVRYAKRLLKLAQQQPLTEHLDVCSSFQALCHKTDDHAEALAAFFEKRAGKFQGR